MSGILKQVIPSCRFNCLPYFQTDVLEKKRRLERLASGG